MGGAEIDARTHASIDLCTECSAVQREILMPRKTKAVLFSGSVKHKGTGLKVKAEGPSVETKSRLTSNGKSWDKSTAAGGALIGAGVGAAVGSIVPVLGTLMGAAVGGAIGGGMVLLSSQQQRTPQPAPIGAPKRCCFCCCGSPTNP